ncbi:MAG: 2,4-dihydroxyhept-2-ene-1,7-dioic acid aldolase [Chloroflexi bacterium]|nr:2,4-dihydroxyhept-2-ene-1,7-dioic acid aldolase [Chloroflexota bacterium]
MTYQNPLRAIWDSGRASYGGWTGSPDPVFAEWIAACGFDEVLIDQQHGAIDPNQLAALITGVMAGGAIPITRVAANDPALIGKSLDMGAQGIVIPMVNTAEEAARAVKACHYPPRGQRSMGPIRAHLTFGFELEDLESPVVIAMVETAAGLDNVDAIASTPGVDAIYVGPADLSLALGVPYDRSARTPEQAAMHAQAVAHILATCQRRGIVAGMNCPDGAIARGYVEQGFRMVTVTSDADMIPRDGMRELAAAKGQPAPG